MLLDNPGDGGLEGTYLGSNRFFLPTGICRWFCPKEVVENERLLFPGLERCVAKLFQAE